MRYISIHAKKTFFCRCRDISASIDKIIFCNFAVMLLFIYILKGNVIKNIMLSMYVMHSLNDEFADAKTPTLLSRKNVI